MTVRADDTAAIVLDSGHRKFLAALAATGVAGSTSLADLRAAASGARRPWQDGGEPMDEIVERAIDGEPAAFPRASISRRAADPRRHSSICTVAAGRFSISTRTTASCGNTRPVRAGPSSASSSRKRPRPHSQARYGRALPRSWPSKPIGPLWFAEAHRSGRRLVGSQPSPRSRHRATRRASVAGQRAGPQLRRLRLQSQPPFLSRLQQTALDAFGGPDGVVLEQLLSRSERPAESLAAPLHADLADLPPVRLVTAGQDVLRDENLAMAVRLAEAGNAVSLDHYPRAPHAFLEALALNTMAVRAIRSAAGWLNDLFADDPSPGNMP